MNINICRICLDFLFPSTLSHRCKPIFMVWCPDDEETEGDAKQVRANSHEEAAERWADENDCNSDYRLLHGSAMTVLVRSCDGSGAQMFRVSGEAVPQYQAEPVDANEQ